MTDDKPTDSEPTPEERTAGPRRSAQTWHFVYQTWKRDTQASDANSNPEAIKVEVAKPAMEGMTPAPAPPPPPEASPSQPESVTASLVISGTKGGAIAASAGSAADRRFGIASMVAAFLIGASLVAAVEYAANIQLRAGAETASNAAQAANSALGQVRMELAALRTGLDQPGRRGGDGASVHAIREEIAGLQWRLADIDTAQESAIARLGQRLDASESEQAQASQRLAGLAENMSRLERRISAIAEQSATSASTTAQKQNERLPSIDGWRVVDMSGQRAIVRNPSGRLYEVASGSEVPGLGIVENVRRTGKRVTVVTPRGAITAVLE